MEEKYGLSIASIVDPAGIVNGDDPGRDGFPFRSHLATEEEEDSDDVSDRRYRVPETEESIDGNENLRLNKKVQRRRQAISRGSRRIKSKETTNDEISPRKPEPLGLINGMESKGLRSHSKAQKNDIVVAANSTRPVEDTGSDIIEFKKPSGKDKVMASESSVDEGNVEEPVGLEVQERSSIAAVKINDPQPCTSQQALASLKNSSKDDSTGDMNDVKSGVTAEIDRSRSPSPDLPEDHYEVETILDYVKNSHGESYWIKWRGWTEDHNTWEPSENLINCFEEKWEFYIARKEEQKRLITESEFVTSETESGRKRRKVTARNLQIPPDPRPLEVRMNEFFEEYKNISEEEIEDTLVKLKNGKKISRWDITKVEKHLELAKDEKLSADIKETLRTQLVVYHVEVLLAKQKSDLKDWEERINEITLGRPKIIIENSVDLAGHPQDFVYENDYVPSDGIVIPDDPPVACQCLEDLCYEGRKKCCSSLFGVEFAYSQKKKLRVQPGSPIYECNKKCKCGPECPNRVVQDGLSPLKGMAMCIYRTKNGCGWGVKTLKSIKKGTFVCLYVGEIINTEEAERRGREYDEEGCTYLFDLDFNEDENYECLYTVDAATHGNVSHFMNHSCDPNLTVFAVWVNCLDPNLPKLALFANRDIAKDEEVTFDYKSHKASNDPEASQELKNNLQIPLIKRKPCLCGAKNCRKMLF